MANIEKDTWGGNWSRIFILIESILECRSKKGMVFHLSMLDLIFTLRGP